MEQVRRRAYHLLSAPNPIQHKQPIQSNALLQFVIPQPGNIKQTSNDFQELDKPIERLPSRRNMHRIGDNLPILFSNPVYKVHGALNIKDNYQFCSCRTDDHFRLKTGQTTQFAQSDLSFESRFESGNLGIASTVPGQRRQFYLALQRDINSPAVTTQWFYFRVKNGENRGTYTFHIINYVKPFSMFKMGMRPCVYSVKKNAGWQRDGFNVDYRQNSLPLDEDRHYYTLTWSYKFTEQNDEVFFAYCYPYTYTRLQRFLDVMEDNHTDKLRRKVITKTHGGNVVELVSITNPQHTNKRTLVITARVHPCQTVSSFVCEGIIQFLLSSKPEAQKLRNQFIIKIIPMLNPDGVINGNYRTSLVGEDLNRQWKNPHKLKHPQIFNSKKIIIESEYKKMLFIDLHGHSKKRSTFMYGCVSRAHPYNAKQFPYILYRKMSHFSYFNCNFYMSKSKEGTARVTFYRAGLETSYTHEISFCGPVKERRHFSIKDYRNIGIELCQNIFAYFYSRILELEVNQDIKRHCDQFYNDEELLNMGNYETNGSSSELEDQKIYESPELKYEQKKISARRIATSHHNQHRHHFNNFVEEHSVNYDAIEHKVPGHEVPELVLHKRPHFDHEIYFKHRQAYLAPKVNVQQLIPENKYFNSCSSSFGLASEKRKLTQSGRSMSLQRKIDSSLSSMQNQNCQSFGILTPTLHKKQYRRYERSQKAKSVQIDKGPSLRVQNLIQGSTAAYGQFRIGMSHSVSMRRESPKRSGTNTPSKA